MHPELEFIVVMAGDRCYQDFVAQAPCEPIELRSSAPQSETTAEAGDGPSDFCVAAASFDEERPEDYVGSTEHVNDITMLAALAPEAIQGPASTYRDFLKGGGADPADPESNVVLNWPADVQAAVADLAEFVAANC